MKKNIIVATLVAAAAMTTASAFASDGTINFTGSVIDASCNVTNAATGSLSVPMGQVSKSAFSAAGDTAAATKFTLKVTGCPTTTDGAVRVSFDGTSVSGNSSVLALTGAGTAGVASGLGIQLSDATQAVVPLNVNSASYALTAGAADLDFVARYIATAAAVTVGSADATASFSIIYN